MVWVSSQVSHLVSATGVMFSVSYPDSPCYVSLPLISSQPLRTQEAGPAQIGARFVTHGTIPFIINSGQAARNRVFKACGIHLAKQQRTRPTMPPMPSQWEPRHRELSFKTTSGFPSERQGPLSHAETVS